MKTLADFKRAMSVGSQWYRKHVNEADFVERTVVKRGSNHVKVADNNGKEAYLDFPKASEFEVNAQGEAEIYMPANEMYKLPRRLILTYKRA